MNHLRTDFDKTSTRKRRLARNAFIKNGAKSKQIAAPIHTFSRRLFRGKIEGRADNYVAACAGRRQSFLVRTSAKARVFSHVFDQTKVEDLNLSPLCYDDVRGFHIPVHHSLVV